MKTSVLTRKIIQKYFEAIDHKGDWQLFISENITFTSIRKITYDKKSFVEATGRFLKVVKSIHINDFIVEGNKACITVNYNLQSPSGNTTTCEVAEVLMVQDDKINSSCIFFDTLSFRSFMAQDRN